jgi:polyphosphate kinase
MRRSGNSKRSFSETITQSNHQPAGAAVSKKDKKNKDEKRKKDKKLAKAEDRSQKANGQDAAGNDAGAPAAAEAGPQKLTGKTYAKELEKLHSELVSLQEWVKYKGLKVCIIFEGRDGAGKGGAIKAITERVSPRIFRVVALPAPTEREKSQMYLQRYVTHLPAAGEIVIFDRSWYNRAGVERVMGFTPEDTVKKFLGGVPLIEKAIVDSGIVLIKYWLEVNPEEQTKRLTQRIEDGRKIWKLSPMDLKSYSRWFDYSRARDEMFAATDTGYAPWYVVKSDDKKRARLNLITHLLQLIPHEKAPREKVKLPKRQKAGDYKDPKYPFKYVPEKF